MDITKENAFKFFEADRLASLQILERYASDGLLGELGGDIDDGMDAEYMLSTEQRSPCYNENDATAAQYQCPFVEAILADAEEEEEGADEDYDEPLVLDCILQRRVDKSDLSHPHQYLCRWRYYEDEDPTWEDRQWLEDEGFKKACDDYDAMKRRQTHAGGGESKSSNAITATLAEDAEAIARGLRAQERTNCEKTMLDPTSTIEDPSVLNARLVHNPSVLEAAVGLDKGLGILVDAFTKYNMRVLNYSPVAMRPRLMTFIRQWEALKSSHRPMLLYHGTRAQNIPSIVERGLLVPGGNGVAVRNGSAFGLGIYCATHPGIAASFCGRTWDENPLKRFELFACVGLVSCTNTAHMRVVRHHHVRRASNDGTPLYIVFQRSDLIIPLWLVNWDSAVETPIDPNATARANISHAKRIRKTPTRSTSIPKTAFHGRFETDCEKTSVPNLKIQNPRQGDIGGRAREHEVLCSEALAAILSSGDDGNDNKEDCKPTADVADAYRGKPMTKRMLKEAPRAVKAAYLAGWLSHKK